MTRRAFLGQCIALGIAPAIVRAESLMPIVGCSPWTARSFGKSRYAGIVEYCETIRLDSGLFVTTYGYATEDGMPFLGNLTR